MQLIKKSSLTRQGRSPMEHGFFMLEALIAMLIFSLGVLGMVAMGAVAINAQNDAQYRTEAANYANDVASAMQLNVDRIAYIDANGVTSNIVNTATLATFAHYAGPSSGSSPCAFTGTASSNAAVTSWITRIVPTASNPRGLPGAAANGLQIQILTGANGYNQANITVCWQAPSDKAQRKHTLVAFIN